jgi:hypothetical protein
MSISGWIAGCYVGCGIYFLIDAAVRRPADGPITVAVSLCAAGLALLWFGLIVLSRGLHRRVVLVGAVAVFITCIVRLVVLTRDASRLANPLRIAFSGDDLTRTIAFIALGSVAFWLGSWIALRRAPLPVSASHDQTTDRIWISRRGVFAVAIGFVLITAFIASTNPVTPGQSETTGYSVLSRVLPTGAFAYLLMTVAFRERLARADKLALVAFFALFSLTDFATGKRGSLFQVFLAVLIVAIWVDPDRRIRVRTVALVGAAGMLVIAPLFSAVIEIRNSLRENYTPAGAVVSTESNVGWFDFGGIWDVVTDRLGTFDNTVAVLTYSPPGRGRDLSASSIVVTTAASLTPDNVWKTNERPLAQIYSEEYEGVPSETIHVGSWSGWGIAYGLFQWWGIAAVGLWALMASLLIRSWSQSPLWGGGFAAYALSMLVVLTLTSGNIDTILAGFIAQAFVAWILVALVGLIDRRRQSDSGPMRSAARRALDRGPSRDKWVSAGSTPSSRT